MNNKAAVKPEWVEKAAGEIMALTVQLSQKKIGKISVDDFANIILKYRPPEEKVAGKLLEACKKAKDHMCHWRASNEAGPHGVYMVLYNALVEYEKVKKEK